MTSFSNCLKQGQFYERETLKHVEYDEYKFSSGIFKEWDIEISLKGEKIYYEVKSETNIFKYGNFCIEYEYNDLPSGVNATTANIWVHYAVKDKIKNQYIIYIIPIDDLRQMIKDKRYIADIRGGDKNKSKFYLFKMGLFEKYIKIKNF